MSEPPGISGMGMRPAIPVGMRSIASTARVGGPQVLKGPTLAPTQSKTASVAKPLPDNVVAQQQQQARAQPKLYIMGRTPAPPTAARASPAFHKQEQARQEGLQEHSKLQQAKAKPPPARPAPPTGRSIQDRMKDLPLKEGEVRTGPKAPAPASAPPPATKAASGRSSSEGETVSKDDTASSAKEGPSLEELEELLDQSLLDAGPIRKPAQEPPKTEEAPAQQPTQRPRGKIRLRPVNPSRPPANAPAGGSGAIRGKTFQATGSELDAVRNEALARRPVQTQSPIQNGPVISREQQQEMMGGTEETVRSNVTPRAQIPPSIVIIADRTQDLAPKAMAGLLPALQEIDGDLEPVFIKQEPLPSIAEGPRAKMDNLGKQIAANLKGQQHLENVLSQHEKGEIVLPSGELNARKTRLAELKAQLPVLNAGYKKEAAAIHEQSGHRNVGSGQRLSKFFRAQFTAAECPLIAKQAVTASIELKRAYGGVKLDSDMAYKMKTTGPTYVKWIEDSIALVTVRPDLIRDQPKVLLELADALFGARTVREASQKGSELLYPNLLQQQADQAVVDLGSRAQQAYAAVNAIIKAEYGSQDVLSEMAGKEETTWAIATATEAVVVSTQTYELLRAALEVPVIPEADVKNEATNTEQKMIVIALKAEPEGSVKRAFMETIFNTNATGKTVEKSDKPLQGDPVLQMASLAKVLNEVNPREVAWVQSYDSMNAHMERPLVAIQIAITQPPLFAQLDGKQVGEIVAKIATLNATRRARKDAGLVTHMATDHAAITEIHKLTQALLKTLPPPKKK